MSINDYMKNDGRFDADKGDLVQTVIIVAAFAVAAIVIVGGISSVVISKGQSAAECINGATNFTQGADAKENCQGSDTSAKARGNTAISDNFGIAPAGGGE